MPQRARVGNRLAANTVPREPPLLVGIGSERQIDGAVEQLMPNARAVACGEYIRLAGLHPLVGDDCPVWQLMQPLGELRVRDDSGGEDDHVRRIRHSARCNAGDARLADKRGHSRVEMHLRAVFCQLILRGQRKLLVKPRQELVRRFDHAQALHLLQDACLRQLQPDCPAADDDDIRAFVADRGAESLLRRAGFSA